MAFRLISTDGAQVFELRRGATLVVGRALSSDVPILDPTISRRHAELSVDGAGALVRDLGSSNGTFVNGERVEQRRVVPGETITFGRVAFDLTEIAAPVSAAEPAPPPPAVGPTILRMRPVHDAHHAFAEALRQRSGSADATAGAAHERDRRKLALLLEVSKALSRAVEVDALLEMIADFIFQILDVDRAAILLLDERDVLVPRVSRDRHGAAFDGKVPQSIARKAVDEQVAVLTANAPNDSRFVGQSIVVQQVQAAICAPLLGGEQRPLGVVYADSLTGTHCVDEDDLDLLAAFAGIAAVALENGRFAERLRHQALVRSNFERFFTPRMAARIASAPDAIRLGGERRRVAVLFNDIRDFTELAASMRPDETARLLTEYFTEMVECVFRHGGTLDKFIGDSVMAQWGAPISEPDDADRAVRTAVDMMRSLERLNARWRREGRPELRIGIGINFGEAFAGNIGSERRLEYTVIGDTVNTASRLCAWAEGGEILISHAVRDALTELVPLVERPPIQLRGKSEPLTVYRVIS